ncbi:MAG TPA: hypothetical protein VGI60_14035 [Chthoniobacterales bacterium]|jgi:hypothetical protein
MREGISTKFGLTILVMAVCGAVMAQEADKGRDQTGADAAARITFGTNFVADPCQTCKYNSNPLSGYFVWGRDNCTSPGDIQAVAVPFIAAADGTPSHISTSIILNDPANCPTDTVTLGLYTDTCGDGPGTLLAQANATVAEATCGLTIAKLAGAPSLTQGTKYWITATTSAAQVALDSRWHPSNTAGYAANQEGVWIPSNGITPGFSVQGSNSLLGRTESNAQGQMFGGNLLLDPCNGLEYEPDGGLEVRGPENCTTEGSTRWAAVPFIAARTGIPRRISAAITLYDPAFCTYNKVTLSLYTDNDCEGTPGTPLVSGQASVPLEAPDLAVAKLQHSPSLTKGIKYWVVATTTAAQANLDARWHGSNNAQLGVNLGDEWVQFSGGTPAFSVE